MHLICALYSVLQQTIIIGGSKSTLYILYKHQTPDYVMET